MKPTTLYRIAPALSRNSQPRAARICFQCIYHFSDGFLTYLITLGHLSLMKSDTFLNIAPSKAQTWYFLIENLPMSDFQEKNGGVQDLEYDLGYDLGYDLEYDLGFLVAGPAGRAG